MSNIKAVVNHAIREQLVKYEIHPFDYYTMPEKNVRDIDISVEQLRMLRDATFDHPRYTVARDMFMLSFYCAGINLIDLM
jgi:hypothetical protein